MARPWDREYEILAARLRDQGLSVEQIEAQLKAQKIETPSWAYADAGTRFGVFKMAGAPRDVQEKFEDAAQVQKYTGIAPSVAVHIPWDTVGDWAAGPRRRRARRPHRRGQPQRVSGSGVSVRQRHPQRGRRPGESRRPYERVRRHHERHGEP